MVSPLVHWLEIETAITLVASMVERQVALLV